MVLWTLLEGHFAVQICLCAYSTLHVCAMTYTYKVLFPSTSQGPILTTYSMIIHHLCMSANLRSLSERLGFFYDQKEFQYLLH